MTIRASEQGSNMKPENWSPSSNSKKVTGDLPPTIPGVDVDAEKTASGEHKITLSAEEALQHARSFPDDTTPLRICFSKDDPDNPRNFGRVRKWYIAVFVTWMNFLYSILLSELSLAFDDISTDYGVSLEIVTLACLSMFALCSGVGCPIMASLSEYYGRSPVYKISIGLLVIFQIPVALAPNIWTILVCRGIGAALGASPPANTGGTIHDVFVRDESGPALALYAISTVTSPPFTLMYNGYVTQNLGWHWNVWIGMIASGITWILLVFTIPETRHTIILQKKAKRVREQLKKEGLNDRVWDENVNEHKGLAFLFKVTLLRSIRFLLTEPIVLAASSYNAFLFGIVYIFQGAFPIVFGKQGHGFNTGEQGLSFTGLFIGTIIAAACNPIQDRYYVRKLKEAGKGVPEARMWLARWGSFLFPISLFWFGWTSFISVHWIVPIIASAFFGIGFFIILLALLSYVVDSYGVYSASALGALIVMRALTGAFPLFGTQMYNTLGKEWASSLLGFLSLLLVPIPVVFFHKGKALRLRSPWAREHFDQQEDLG